MRAMWLAPTAMRECLAVFDLCARSAAAHALCVWMCLVKGRDRSLCTRLSADSSMLLRAMRTRCACAASGCMFRAWRAGVRMLLLLGTGALLTGAVRMLCLAGLAGWAL